METAQGALAVVTSVTSHAVPAVEASNDDERWGHVVGASSGNGWGGGVEGVEEVERGGGEEVERGRGGAGQPSEGAREGVVTRQRSRKSVLLGESAEV